jgi:hypothetical protein
VGIQLQVQTLRCSCILQQRGVATGVGLHYEQSTPLAGRVLMYVYTARGRTHGERSTSRTGSVTDHPSLFGPSTSLACVPIYPSSHWSCRVCKYARHSLCISVLDGPRTGANGRKKHRATPALRDTVDPGNLKVSSASPFQPKNMPGCHGTRLTSRL